MRAGVYLTLLAVSLVTAACDDDDDPTGIPAQQTFAATMTGAAEIPPVITTATGTVTVTLNTSAKTFSYTMTVSGLTGVSGAHIHGPATTAEPAGILVPLTSPTTSPITGTFAAAQITAPGVSVDSLISLMRAGRTYVNVHTTANPGGAIRGQLILQ